MDILYGKHAVHEALRSGRNARRILIAMGTEEDPEVDSILQLARNVDVPVETAKRQRLNDIAHSEHHKGIVGYFHHREQPTLQKLLEVVEPPGLLLMLDEVQDPHNLGALLRSCDAMGAAGCIIPGQRAVGVTSTVAKVSAGASEYVPCVTVPNIAHAIRQCKEAGYWCVGLAHTESATVDSWDFTSPTVIVLGSEGSGMRHLTRTLCDALLRIPMMGSVSSLNVAAAGAIVMYEAARQRGWK